MKIEYQVILKSPAMTGQDGIIGKDLDIVTKINENGEPYFSGSLIKGIAREYIEKFSKALENKFPVGKYFGKEGEIKSHLRFSNLYLDKTKNYEGLGELLLDDRSGIKLDRGSKTTLEGSLFSYGYIKSGLVFVGEIEIFTPMDKENLNFFKGVLERIDLIGGLKSRGLGKVELKIQNIVEDSQEKSKNIELKKFKKFKIILKPMENLILKDNEIGNEITTKNYIQGSTLRGALIGFLTEKYNMNLEELLRSLKVSQLLPRGTFVAPGSILESKYPIENNIKIKTNKLFMDNLDEGKIKFERFGTPIVNENYEKITLNRSSEINIGIDSKTKTSEEGKIYNKEVLLVKDLEFIGEIYLAENLEEVLNNKIIYIGKNKSKGFGKCLINIEKIQENKNKITLDILEKFSQKIAKDKKYFTIDFISDMVLPFMSINEIGEQIKNLLELNEVTWEESKSYINISSMGGYNQLNRIRKGNEFIIDKGGVLTYSVENFSEPLINKLNLLEEQGIGTRKLEGFGQIEINSKKHFEVK